MALLCVPPIAVTEPHEQTIGATEIESVVVDKKWRNRDNVKNVKRNKRVIWSSFSWRMIAASAVALYQIYLKDTSLWGAYV